VVLVLLVAATAAQAEDRAAARSAYIEGSKHYDLNQFTEALEAFKRAYWNYEDPVILYNIAQCHRALGHKKEAVDFYRSYLRKSSTASNRADVQKLIAELEAAMAAERPTAPIHPVEPAPLPKVAPSPEPIHVAPAPVVVAPAPVAKPVWKRGWLWGIVGGVVAAGVIVGVGVGVGLQPEAPKAAGTVTF
jgi:tetratricopeptide (TPR) repeat protein